MLTLEASDTELPYERDAAVYARRLADLPGFAFLDSRKRRAEVGQYDILTALPDTLLRLSDFDNNLTHWMEALEGQLEINTLSVRTRIGIGFMDYDSAAANLGVAGPTLRPALVGIYSWYVLQDHQLGRSWLITDPALAPNTKAMIEARLRKPPKRTADPFRLQEPFRAEVSHEEYLKRVEQIREYVSAGDCYQVNFAHRFSSRFMGDPFEAYNHLRDVAPGDFSAYLALEENHAVLSLSPERFLSIEAGRVKSQPIKGTRPRSLNPLEDAAIARELRESEKDRAENIMITDLLRNDLGRFCKAGSVVTSELCALHSYDNVHHLVSMIEGQLQTGMTPGQVLLGCSPGGSITGAPKKRAAEIIRELEPVPRGVYCGSIFALGCDGWLQSSIAIRTFEIVNDAIYCWGGGGIVYDSQAESEYQETLDKVSGFMRAIESL